MGAEDLGAQAVDGADAGGVQRRIQLLPPVALVGGQVRPSQVPAHLLADPVAHLAGSLPGKRDRDGAPRLPVHEEREIAGHQGAGLAGAGAGRDHHVATASRHRRSLFWAGLHLGNDGVYVRYHQPAILLNPCR